MPPANANRAASMLLVGTALLCGASLAPAQILNESSKLLPAGGVEGADFGTAIGVAGDVAVVGADDLFAPGNPGGASVFRWDGVTWAQEQSLVASDGSDGDLFGRSVSVSNDVILIGALGHDDGAVGAGAAYVFGWDGVSWNEEQKLVATGAVAGDSFGHSVSVSGNVALIGAEGVDDNGDEAGAAYIFRYDGASWIQEQKLLAPDGNAGDGFGTAVAVSHDLAVVGAPYDEDNGTGQGSAEVFRWDGSNWLHEQKLLPGDSTLFFGRQLAVSEDVILVGADADNDNGSGAGAAYAFRWNGASWTQEQKIHASDGTSFDRFAASVSVFGDLAVIGARQRDDNGAESGAAYVFRWNGSSWVEQEKLLPTDGAAEDEFGHAVAAFGPFALVGAPFDDTNGSRSGAAYVFNLGCLDGFFGLACDECPGGADNPCSGNGACDDGFAGSGVCTCDEGWVGSACATAVSDIPAVSHWGLILIALSVLIGARLVFGPRSHERTGSP